MSNAQIDPDPSSEEMTSALERVLADPEVGGNARLSALLRHLVECVQTGQSTRLKGTSIAIDVFGRETDFDPQTDAIVRTEARRLRQALAGHYQGAGAEDPIRIVVPKGTYVPRFERRAPAVAAPRPPAGEPTPSAATDAPADGPSAPGPRRRDVTLRRVAIVLLLAVGLATAAAVLLTQPDPTLRGAATASPAPAVLIVPFEAGGASEQVQTLVSGLTAELISDLMRFPDFRLYSFDSSLAQSDAILLAAEDDLAYVVRGIVRSDARRLTVVVQLAQAKDGRILWSETFRRPLEPEALLRMQTEIAGEIASTIGQPFGILRNAVAARLADAAGAELESFACVMRAYTYRRANRSDLYAPVRACLEDAVARDPDYAEAWAMLGYLRLDASRFGYETGKVTDPSALYAKARAAATRALALQPGHVEATKALSLVEHYAGDYAESQRLAREAVALNPNDPDALAQLGWRLSVRGDFEEGLLYLERAIERSVSPPHWYFQPIAVERLMAGDMAGMLAVARRAALDGSSVSDALLAIAHAGLGDAGEARDALDRMARKWPLLSEDPAAAFARHHLADDLIAALVDGLRAAGGHAPARAEFGSTALPVPN